MSTNKDEIRKLKERNRQLEKQVDSLLRDKDHLEDTIRTERATEQMRIRQKTWDTIQMARFEEV